MNKQTHARTHILFRMYARIHTYIHASPTTSSPRTNTHGTHVFIQMLLLHIYLHTCTYIYIHKYTYIHPYNINIFICIYMYVSIHLSIYVYGRIYHHELWQNVCVCVCMCVRARACVRVFESSRTARTLTKIVAHACMRVASAVVINQMAARLVRATANKIIRVLIYSLFYRALLQKRPVILRSLLIVATPWRDCQQNYTSHVTQLASILTINHVTHVNESCHKHEWVMSHMAARLGMGCLHFVGSFKLWVSFADYSLFYRALLPNEPDGSSSCYGVATLRRLLQITGLFWRI